MTVPAETPADMVIERQVNEAIASGHPLPRWGWPQPPPYNGATGAERVYVWQQNRIGQMLGLMPRLGTCSACERRKAEGSHGEIYFRPFALHLVCRSCHARIHRRYGSPGTWQDFLNDGTPAGSWLRILPMKPISRVDALEIAKRPDVLKALAEYSAALQAGKSE